MYFCEDCDVDFTVFHAMNDVQKFCTICDSESIRKMLTKPIRLTKKKDKSTGHLTKKYIEENKEVLKNLKEEAQKDYDGT